MKKIILTDFFTTVSWKGFCTSLSFLTIKFGNLIKGKNVEKLEKKLLDFLGTKNSKILSFYNGRTAIFQALKMIGIQKGDEIIINGYNCIAVINSILQSGGIPVYVDIDKKNLSFDLDELKAQITDKTKVIIVQHTFGKTAPIKEILKLAKKNNLLVIEDVAHSLGSEFENKKHGSFGDFAIFSSGRDKVFSGVNGGFLLINNDKFISKDTLQRVSTSLKNAPKILVMRNLLYNVFGYFAYKTYSFFGLGKFIIFASRKLHLVNEILDDKEKKCENTDLYYKLPNSLAKLAFDDLKNIDEYAEKRRKIAKYYDENLKFKQFKKAFEEDKNEKLNYFRYAIVLKNNKEAEEFYNYTRKNKILVGITWSRANIVPKGIVLAKTKYKGNCEKAEKLALRIVFLPNHKFMTKKDLKRVVKLCNEFKNLDVV